MCYALFKAEIIGYREVSERGVCGGYCGEAEVKGP
jgi:hypothetical protein